MMLVYMYSDSHSCIIAFVVYSSFRYSYCLFNEMFFFSLAIAFVIIIIVNVGNTP